MVRAKTTTRLAVYFVRAGARALHRTPAAGAQVANGQFVAALLSEWHSCAAEYHHELVVTYC